MSGTDVGTAAQSGSGVNAAPPGSLSDDSRPAHIPPADAASEEARRARRRLAEVDTAVVKVGSAILAGTGRLDPEALDGLAKTVATLRDGGLRVVLVVSGAVAAGYVPLGLSSAAAVRVGQAIGRREPAAARRANATSSP